MIPLQGQRVLPIDPDAQDDAFERAHLQRALDQRNEIHPDDPRYLSLEDRELSDEFSAEYKLNIDDLFAFIGD